MSALRLRLLVRLLLVLMQRLRARAEVGRSAPGGGGGGGARPGRHPAAAAAADADATSRAGAPTRKIFFARHACWGAVDTAAASAAVEASVTPPTTVLAVAGCRIKRELPLGSAARRCGRVGGLRHGLPVCIRLRGSVHMCGRRVRGGLHMCPCRTQLTSRGWHYRVLFLVLVEATLPTPVWEVCTQRMASPAESNTEHGWCL